MKLIAKDTKTMLAEIKQAIINNTTVTFTYRKDDGSQKERTVTPIKLFNTAKGEMFTAIDSGVSKSFYVNKIVQDNVEEDKAETIEKTEQVSEEENPFYKPIMEVIRSKVETFKIKGADVPGYGGYLVYEALSELFAAKKLMWLYPHRAKRWLVQPINDYWIEKECDENGRKYPYTWMLKAKVYYSNYGYSWQWKEPSKKVEIMDIDIYKLFNHEDAYAGDYGMVMIEANKHRFKKVNFDGKVKNINLYVNLFFHIDGKTVNGIVTKVWEDEVRIYDFSSKSEVRYKYTDIDEYKILEEWKTTKRNEEKQKLLEKPLVVDIKGNSFAYLKKDNSLQKIFNSVIDNGGMWDSEYNAKRIVGYLNAVAQKKTPFPKITQGHSDCTLLINRTERGKKKNIYQGDNKQYKGVDKYEYYLVDSMGVKEYGEFLLEVEVLGTKDFEYESEHSLPDIKPIAEEMYRKAPMIWQSDFTFLKYESKFKRKLAIRTSSDLSKKFKEGQTVQFPQSGPQDWKVISIDTKEDRLIVQLEETGYKKVVPMNIVTKINGKYMRFVR